MLGRAADQLDSPRLYQALPARRKSAGKCSTLYIYVYKREQCMVCSFPSLFSKGMISKLATPSFKTQAVVTDGSMLFCLLHGPASPIMRELSMSQCPIRHENPILNRAKRSSPTSLKDEKTLKSNGPIPLYYKSPYGL